MDITGNPWIVTAADVAAGPVTVWNGAASIVQIVFSKYNGVGDTAVVNRLNGREFLSLHGAADGSDVRAGGMAWTNDGLVVPQNGITNGQLSIYHR